MTRPPCIAFTPGPIGNRCSRCGWSKYAHGRRRKEALCPATGKIRHRTRAAAAKRVHRLSQQRRAGQDPESLMAYLCRHCRDWHVGHSATGNDDIATARSRVEGE